MVEPLFWRPLHWYRLEIHLAGSARRESNEPDKAVQRALLPVGSRQEAEMLLRRILPDHTVTMTRPPRKARLRAPFSYHFLAAGRDEHVAVSARGRVRRLTEFAPLAKLQSIRSERGPVQRWLGIGSIHLDIAGRRSSVRWLHRAADEAAALMEELPPACERARVAETSAAAGRALAAAPGQSSGGTATT
jgi:putative membrane protein